MSVLPGFHRRGALRTAAAPFLGFTQQVDPAELPEPAELEAALVPYTLPAGHVGLHDVFAPHGSGPNVSDRWRRVIVARFIAADAELGESTYPDVRRRDFLDLRLRVSLLIGTSASQYRTGVPFAREYFLVSGEDRKGRGFRRHAFERGEGYLGDASVQARPPPRSAL